MSDPALKPASVLCADLAQRRIGCLELLEHYLARAERFDGALNAIVVRDVEQARTRAAEADAALQRGENWGPLHGLPMTVKESFDVAGLPTTWGAPMFKDRLADRDAVIVERLRGAGAVVVGKTNVPVMLSDWQAYNPIYGTTNNPWDLSRTPGGSSGGSAAALAAGLTGLEFGSDIGGSIRFPAHFCGVYGLKPTLGLIPSRGHSPVPSVSEPDLAVVGPLARHVDDLELALDITAGPDVLRADGWRLDLPGEPRTALNDFRVAVWRDSPIAPVDDSVAGRLQHVVDCLAGAGATIADGHKPALPDEMLFQGYMELLGPIVTFGRPADEIAAAKAAALSLADDDHSDDAWATRSMAMTHQEWMMRHGMREHWRYLWHDFFQHVDVLLCPVSSTPAFPQDQSEPQGARTLAINGRPEPYNNQLFWAAVTTTVGLPSVAAPAGLTPEGLPVGVQIVVPAWHEKRAIQFARLLAAETGGFTPPPGYAD